MPRRILAFLLLGVPAAAAAFEAIDTLPTVTRFPAYYVLGEAARPLTYWAQAGVMFDDNVLRRPVGSESETITRYGAGVRAEQRIYGRQTLRLEARGDYYAFQQFETLDHFAYGLRGEWLWELGNQLSGTLGYSREQAFAGLEERDTVTRDLITEQRFEGSAAYRLAPDWRIRGAVSQVSTDRPERRFAEVDSLGVSAGIDYVTPLGNALGVELRQARGDAPVPERVDATGRLVNNDYDEREIAGVIIYNLGTQLRVDGRLGYTQREYGDLPGRDFDGVTWRAGVLWSPGNKTALRFDAYKLPRSIIDIAAAHVTVQGVSFGPSWAPTAKLVLSARVLREERDFEGDVATALGLEVLRRDTVLAYRVALGWDLSARFRAGLGYDAGERKSNLAPRVYDYSAWMANLRYSF